MTSAFGAQAKVHVSVLLRGADAAMDALLRDEQAQQDLVALYEPGLMPMLSVERALAHRLFQMRFCRSVVDAGRVNA